MALKVLDKIDFMQNLTLTFTMLDSKQDIYSKSLSCLMATLARNRTHAYTMFIASDIIYIERAPV